MSGMMTSKKTSSNDSSNFQYHGRYLVNNFIASDCPIIGKIAGKYFRMTRNICDWMESNMCINHVTIYKKIHSTNKKIISKKRF